MNRAILGVGVAILLVAIALVVSPIALTGAESLTTLAEIGVFTLPVGIVVVLLGGVAPDPSITTVGGVFGNPVENAIHDRRGAAPSVVPARARGSPRQPVNCRQCYTLVAWDAILCPRCGRARDCRSCGRDLDWSGTTIVCVPCAHPEVYCNCREAHHAYPVRRPAGARL
ncbi:MAG TPA: hypothetical protein VMH90_06105 [Thermoplasmata archaeon]|nr:hypothetical protein [Thermoplasmata archaeon]